MLSTRTDARTSPAHTPPTPPPPAPAGMALTELLAALEGERRTHAAATRAGQTRQDNATMNEQQPIDRLAQFLLDEMPQEIGPDEGAVDVAIRLLRGAGVQRRADELARAMGHEPDNAATGTANTEPQEDHAPAPRFAGESTLDQELGALDQFHVPDTVNHLRDLAYATAVAAGWHDTRVIEGVQRQASAGERVALIHEEATELLRHIREGEPAGIAAGTELADIVIRCLDYAGRYEINLGELIVEKMLYNRTRAIRHGGRTL